MEMPKPRGMPLVMPRPAEISKATGVPVATMTATAMPMPEYDEPYWPAHWQIRRLKPGVGAPDVLVYKQQQGPYHIARLTVGDLRMYTHKRTTSEEAGEYALQQYMNETVAGMRDSEAE